MEAILKTKDISDQLGVNPTTVQRWTKYFNISCSQNELGHHVYNKDQEKLFLYINQELKNGKKMREIDLTHLQASNQTKPQPRPSTSVATSDYEYKLKEMMNHVQEIEVKLAQKADEVVSYQLLKHRSEIDEMTTLLKRLENRLITIEAQHKEQSHHESLQVASGGGSKKKWKTLMQMFSF